MALQEMIKTGLSLVRDDPQHDLRLGFRCRLLSSFDEVGDPEPHRVGHMRRVKLATLAIERVLPMWESSLPTDRTPHQALELAEKVFSKVISSPVAEREIGRLWTHCDDLMWRHEDRQTILMVGYGAIQVAREALSETHFGCEQVNDGDSDFDVEPYDNDSSYFAAAAYSGGAAWEANSNPEKRLEFWTWWLISAVDMAMNAACT